MNYAFLIILVIYETIVFQRVLRSLWAVVLHARRNAINFYITDFWAATLGWSPSLWFLSQNINALKMHYYVSPFDWIVCATLAVGQLVGMIWFRYGSGGRIDDKTVPGLALAILILTGAVVGIAVTAVLFALAVILAAITLATPIVPVAVAGIYLSLKLISIFRN